MYGTTVNRELFCVQELWSEEKLETGTGGLNVVPSLVPHCYVTWDKPHPHFLLQLPHVRELPVLLHQDIKGEELRPDCKPFIGAQEDIARLCGGKQAL